MGAIGNTLIGIDYLQPSSPAPPAFKSRGTHTIPRFIGGNPNATDTTDLATVIAQGAPDVPAGVTSVTSSDISGNPVTVAPAGLPVTAAAVSAAPTSLGSTTTFTLGGFVSTIGADLADPFNHLIVVGVVLLVVWWLAAKLKF